MTMNRSEVVSVDPIELNDEYDYKQTSLYKFYLSVIILQNLILITSVIIYIIIFVTTPSIRKQRNKWLGLHAAILILVDHVLLTVVFQQHVHDSWANVLSCKAHLVMLYIQRIMTNVSLTIVIFERVICQIFSIADTPGLRRSMVVAMMVATWIIPYILGTALIFSGKKDPFHVFAENNCFLFTGKVLRNIRHAMSTVSVCVDAGFVLLLIFTNYGPISCRRIQNPPIEVLHVIVGMSLLLVPAGLALLSDSPYLQFYHEAVVAALFTLMQTTLCLQPLLWITIDSGMRQRLKHYIILIKIQGLFVLGRQYTGDHIELINDDG